MREFVFLHFTNNMVKDRYKTINQEYTGIFKDKGSKFISIVYPINSIHEVKNLVQNIKKEHQGARHVCWAYRYGYEKEQYRFYDDGEPNNSAGKPILGQIDAYDITNVLACVVRYFGGTLLGVGGLIQAYKEATKNALEQASIIEKEIETLFTALFPYDIQTTLTQIITNNKGSIISQDFKESCSFTIGIPKRNTSLFFEQTQALIQQSKLSISPL